MAYTSFLRLLPVQQMETNKQVFASSNLAEIRLHFRLVSFVARRKTLRLPKSKQENRLHGLFCCELFAASMFSQKKKLRSLVDLFTVLWNRDHLL